MKPAGDRCWRKGLRKAKRGIPAGRRTTHLAETTYGRQQKARDRDALFAQQRENAAQRVTL